MFLGIRDKPSSTNPILRCNSLHVDILNCLCLFLNSSRSSCKTEPIQKRRQTVRVLGPLKPPWPWRPGPRLCPHTVRHGALVLSVGSAGNKGWELAPPPLTLQRRGRPAGPHQPWPEPEATGTSLPEVGERHKRPCGTLLAGATQGARVRTATHAPAHPTCTPPVARVARNSTGRGVRRPRRGSFTLSLVCGWEKRGAQGPMFA